LGILLSVRFKHNDDLQLIATYEFVYTKSLF